MKTSRVWIAVVVAGALLATGLAVERAGAQEIIGKPVFKPVVPPASVELATPPLSGSGGGAFYYCHVVNVSPKPLAFRIEIRDALGSAFQWHDTDCSEKVTYAPNEGCRVSTFVTGGLPMLCRIRVTGTADQSAARGALQMQDGEALSGWVAVEAR